MQKQASVSSARRHTRERSLSSSVDWVKIEQQLHNIPEDFKSSKFNSLKRVIEILSKDKPQWALAELEQELKKVEAVIDTVVDSHHLGFNHAIENYSKILTLFKECKDQVAALRASFDEAQSRIGAVSSNLRGQWHKSMALQGSIAMLKDVQAAMADHATLQQHLPKKEWLAAVPVLLRLANKLSIQEIANLGALSGVRASVRPAYDQIASALVAEIILLTFNRPQSYAVPAAAAAASNGRSTAVAAASGPVAHHARIAALLSERQDAAAVRRAAGGFRAGGTEEGDVRMQKLLDALVQLDAVDLLRDGVLTAVEPQVRALMERCLTSSQAASDGVVDRRGGDLAGGDAHRAFVPPAAGERVSAVVLSLLVALLLVFHNCCKLYTKLAVAGERLATARRLYGRVMTGLVRREGGFTTPEQDETTVVHALAEAASADRDTVWGLLQKEIVGLFSYLIRAPFTQTSAAQADTEAVTSTDGGQAGSQWLTNLLRSEVYSSLLSSRPKARQGSISFRFASTTAGGGAAAAPLESDSAAPVVLEYRDLADAALRRLTAPTPFLVWCLYTPTVHFVREVGSLLGPRTAATGSRSVLQHFLDDFTSETMLPRLMAEAKAAAQAIISQKNAFAPSTSVAMEGGALGLQAAESLSSLFTELSLWARAMPQYADELCAVAAGALNVLDERCAALLDGVLQQEGTLAALLERRAISANLSAEPAVRFVQSEELFEDPFRNAESRASDDMLRAIVAATDHNAPSRPQAETVKIAQRLAGIAATLLHLTRSIERVGRCFTTEHNAHHDIATSATLNTTTPRAGGASPAAGSAELATLGGMNDSLRSSSRLKRLKSGSSSSDFGEGEGGAGGGDADGRAPELLPELQSVLPALNLPTRGHAAAASMLARTLHEAQDVLPLNLVHLAKQMRLRAGRCLATVRLLVAATAAQTFASVAAAGSHVLGADGARDRDPRITGFIRTCGRLVEELRPLLPPHCQRYVFADLPRVAYQCLMWTVPRVEVVNSIGLERLLQWLLLLKGALVPLTGLDAAASAMHGLALDASEAALSAAQAYVQLLQGPVNNIVLEASRAESRGKFASADWLSLLDVPVMSRSVTKGQRLQLRQAIDSWGGGGGTAAPPPRPAGTSRGSPPTTLRDVEPGVLGGQAAAAGRGSPGARSPATRGSQSPAAPGSPAAADDGKAKAPASVRNRSRISSVMSAMPWQRADPGKGPPP